MITKMVKPWNEVRCRGMRKDLRCLADVPEIKTYVRTHPMYGGAVMSYKK